MGRPSTYDPKKPYSKLAENYIASCGREQTKLPKISEFCREFIEKSEDAINDWLKKGENVEELSGAIKRVKDAQKEQLMDDGLYGGKEVNNAMAIFLLKANHGLIETGRTEFVGKDGKPIEFQLNIKLDMAGDYIPQVGGIITAPATNTTQSDSVQSPSVAQESPKDNNSDNGVTPASFI